MVPYLSKSVAKFKNLTAKDRLKVFSRTGSGVNVIRANFVGRKWAYPSNVLHLAVETQNHGHSAVFPKSIPIWFTKLFTKQGDIVLDPFMGSGTSCEAALELGRHAIGIDLMDEYVLLAYRRLQRLLMS